MGKGFILGLILILGLAGYNSAAQEAEEVSEPEVSPSSSDVERVEVTGSRIKRIDIEGPSPILTLDRDYLDRSGYNSLSDVLRDTTAVSFGAMREQAGSAASDVATIGLRGLGATRTLVLLNGRRMAQEALTQAVDINLIPMAAVERIEILRDGASAVYGSEAIGGVVNIITKKNYNGVDAFVKYSMPQEGGAEETEISVVGGKSTSKASIMVVGRYNHKAKLMDSDRWWTNGGESVYGNPGNYYVAGSAGLETDPNNACPAQYLRVDGADTYCAFPHATLSTNIPEITQYNGLIESNFKINESLTLFARVLVGYKESRWQYAPTPTSGLQVAGSALNDAADNLPVAAGDTVSVYYRLTEIGNRENVTTNLNYGAYVGARGYLGASTWDWEATVGYNNNEKESKGKNNVKTSALTTAIENDTYNPFAAGSKGDISSAVVDTFTKMSSSLKSFDLQFTGEVFDMSAGPASAAMGVSTFTNEYDVSLDENSGNLDVIGSGGTAGGGKRDVYSAFNEWSLPVLSNLEVQVAARYDHYSDFGDTVNPKLGIRYAPTDAWMVRGSVGTAFLAPSLDELYKASSFGYPTFKDEVGCEQQGGSYCNARQYNLISSANKDLEEEKAITASVGTVFQPNEDFNMALDIWQVQMDNVVGLDLNAITEAEKKFGTAYVESFGIEIERQANGVLTGVRAPALNLQSSETRGLDVSLGYTLPVAILGQRLGLREHFSYILLQKTESFPGLGKENTAGEGPQWRNNLSLSVSSDVSEFSMTGRTIAKISKANGAEGELPIYTEYDINYSHSFAWEGRISAGIKNVFGSTPPIDETYSRGLYASIYNPYGRVYYLGYGQSFF